MTISIFTNDPQIEGKDKRTTNDALQTILVVRKVNRRACGLIRRSDHGERDPRICGIHEGIVEKEGHHEVP